MYVINFFGAPGAGKSAAAMRLAGHLKSMGFNAEYVPEFAKEQVWSKSAHLLLKQNWIFANQELRLSLLRGQVDFAITDSPLPMSYFYVPTDYPPAFKTLCFHFFNEYKNLNVFLTRSHDYESVGRVQTESEAIAMEARMRIFLFDNGIESLELSSDLASPEYIWSRLRVILSSSGSSLE